MRQSTTNLFILVLNLCLLTLSAYPQVARNLESSNTEVGLEQDKEALLRDYYKLASEPGLAGNSMLTIYKDEYLEAIQFPVGGIGTGCIQFDGKAIPRYWQIFNNMTHDFIPNSFFAIQVKENDNVFIRALQADSVVGFQPMNGLEASCKFPFLRYDFEDEIPVKVQMKVFNPFIPTDLKNSGIPAVFYQFTIQNQSTETISVSLLASQQNAIGFSQIPKITKGNSFAERFQTSLDRKPVQGNMSEYYGENKNTIVHTENSTYLLMEGKFSPDSEHFGQMALILFDEVEEIQGAASLDYNEKFLSGFRLSGNIKTKSKTRKSKAGQTWTGALNSKIILKPGESQEINYALVWFFPNGLNGGHLNNWDAWGNGDWEGHGNYYAKHWNSVKEIADYITNNRLWLTRTTEKFSKSFYNTNLPNWLVERIGNQLSILKSRTIFHDQNGYVGLWEGCGSGDGSCAGNCNHVWHYAQSHARLFPELARKIKEQSFQAIKEDGQIPYRQPAGSPAFDGQCGDIIGAYREYLLSSDESWLIEQYPAIKKALNYLVKKHDADMDGWLSDLPKHTTYDASMTGNPSFLTSLYLVALKAGSNMAKACNDIEQEKEWNSIAKKSLEIQNQRLWNGEYFIQIPGDARATDYENGCLSDQLLGLWWAEQIGIDDLYPDYRVYSATKSIFRYNFKSNLKSHMQLARKFAKPEEAGMVVCSWPENDRTKYASGYSDEVWTTFEYTIGALLIKHMEWKKALILLRSGYNRYSGLLKTGYKTDNGWGNFGFSGNPFGDDECGQFYSRALSSWSVLLAAQGFKYSAPDSLIGFDPKWNPENHVSFFSVAEGWGTFKQIQTEKKQINFVELDYGKLIVENIQIPLFQNAHNKQIECKYKGEILEIATKIVNGNLHIKLPSLEFETGDKLEIIQE